MKKLISLFAMVIFMAGMVVAQNNNSATVKQINDYNKANVEQNGSNTADIYQMTTSDHVSGTENRAFVDQDGDNNRLNYDVEGYDNLLRSNQYGENNRAVIDQSVWHDGSNYSNSVYVDQDNTESGNVGNTINADLKGDENVFRFTQMGDDNHILGTSPFTYEGDYSNININQVGTWNRTKGNIKGSNQKVDVDQLGYDNFAKIEVNDGLGGSPGSFEQFITILQENDRNDARVDIDGGSNRVRVEQAGADAGAAGDQRSRVDITGDDNIVKHYQTLDGEGGLRQGNNLAKSEITGDGNRSIIGKVLGQEGLDNRAIHVITGDDNKAFTDQDGGQNIARVTQSGDDNYAKQVQDVWGTNNYGYAPKEANLNVSRITQMNDNNTAKTYQFGDENVVRVDQDGDDRAFVDQGIWDQKRSWNHGEPLEQFGNNNRAIIDQNGGVNVSKVLQLGNHNNVNISQGGIIQQQ